MMSELLDASTHSRNVRDNAHKRNLRAPRKRRVYTYVRESACVSYPPPSPSSPLKPYSIRVSSDITDHWAAKLRSEIPRE